MKKKYLKCYLSSIGTVKKVDYKGFSIVSEKNAEDISKCVLKKEQYLANNDFIHSGSEI